MKTQTKVILDTWIGRPAVAILNIIARLLGKLLAIDHSLDRIPERIVVCKFLGMGSIIQSTPLLQTLRRNFPDSEIIFITSTSNRKLLESIDVIDKIFDVDDRSFTSTLRSTFFVIQSLWQKKADLYIDLETYSFYSTVLATLSCSRNRFGFYRAERNINMGVYTHMMYFNAKAPIAQAYLQMARLAACRTVVENLYPFFITESDRMGFRRKLIETVGTLQGGLIVINPNASDLRIERRWPATYFAELIKMLRDSYPEKIFLIIGAANESRLTARIHSMLDVKMRERVFDTAGKFSLYELFALIDNSEAMISNDTGPMHISFALNKPTISLFGPSSPAQYGQNPNAFGIYKNIYCSPCVHDFLTPPCRGDNQCMKQISVEEVFDLCKEIFSASSSNGRTLVQSIGYLKNDDYASLGIVERKRKISRQEIVTVDCACCKGSQGAVILRGLTSIYSSQPWTVTECLTCGNMITIPVPSAELLNEIYGKSYLYPVHMLAAGEKKFRSEEMAEYIRKIVKPGSGKSVFEAGCMYGYLLDQLRNDYSVKGIEIGAEAVTHCRNSGLDVQDMSIESYLDRDSEKFDLIILSHVLEHLLSPDVVIAKLGDRLKPGGKIMICVPDPRSFCRKLFGKYWGWWQVPVHINHFTGPALQRLANRHNMKIERVRHKGGDSLMLLLNFINLFGFRNRGKAPGKFQRVVVTCFSAVFRYWYFIGNEELTVVMIRE